MSRESEPAAVSRESSDMAARVTEMSSLWHRSGAHAVAAPLAAILLALASGGIVMAAVFSSFSKPVSAYGSLLSGALGSPYALQLTLTDSIPLILASLAVAFAFQGGVFNLGVPGQMVMGAITATCLGYTLDLPGWQLIPVCLVVGAASGSLWALAAGLLKVGRGVHEIISTMMLNYVALYLLKYLLEGVNGGFAPMQGPLNYNFATAPVNVRFPVIVPASLTPLAQLNLAFPLSLLAALVFWFVLRRTVTGFEIRAVGANPRASLFAGVRVTRRRLMAFGISGAFAGLTAVAVIFGAQGQLSSDFPAFTIGFEAIAIALVARNSASGCVIVSILFGALESGSTTMQQQYPFVDPSIILTIEGLILLFVAAEGMMRSAAFKSWSAAFRSQASDARS